MIGGARDLFVHRLRTMLWVEEELAEHVLPQLFEQVHAADLRWSVEKHLGETEEHAKTLRRILVRLDAPVDPEPGAPLPAAAVDVAPSDLADLVHLDVIVRTEHAEIAAYTGLVHLALALGEDEVALLLRETMEQEEYALEQAEYALTKLLAEKVESAG